VLVSGDITCAWFFYEMMKIFTEFCSRRLVSEWRFGIVLYAVYTCSGVTDEALLTVWLDQVRTCSPYGLHLLLCYCVRTRVYLLLPISLSLTVAEKRLCVLRGNSVSEGVCRRECAFVKGIRSVHRLLVRMLYSVYCTCGASMIFTFFFWPVFVCE
jgi:hypothetical protein